MNPAIALAFLAGLSVGVVVVLPVMALLFAHGEREREAEEADAGVRS